MTTWSISRARSSTAHRDQAEQREPLDLVGDQIAGQTVR